VGAPGEGEEGAFDILLTRTPQAPHPWVSLTPDALEEAIARLQANVAAQALAASALAQVLRIGAQLPFEDALALESYAYSTLLGGAAFRSWRAANPVRDRPAEAGDVRIERDGDAAVVRLVRPARRNALDAAMRDALCDCLSMIRDDPSVRRAALRGEGAGFCAGGDLDEFGAAQDLAAAHFIRTLQSPARLAHACGGRLEAYVHGAAIGAGVEIAAACARVAAHPDATFRLPELAMGLIPGAGGTVTIPRRIGRHRACYLGLIGAAIDARTACAWGLVDRLETRR
jgi:hypothetical protein